MIGQTIKGRKKQLAGENSQQNKWLSIEGTQLGDYTAHEVAFEVLADEETVGQTMFSELQSVADQKTGDIVMILLGGRGAQALHKLLGEKARSNEIDALLGRLHVFTQDALAPLRMNNSLSFVRDFERLLGPDFFKKIKSFTPMRTETSDLEAEMRSLISRFDELGGIDIFFLGLGPEAENASHLCYIKPNSGATVSDFAGVIPISSSILEHHISKFKAGGTEISEADETECRNARFILTLGPAAILSARRVVQSIVDASTAPAKVACFDAYVNAELSEDATERARQLDANPGLWLRLHKNLRCLILPDVLAQNEE